MFCDNIEKFTKFLSVKQNCYKDKMVLCYFKEMLRLERSMLWLTFKTSTAALQCMGRDVINSANLFHMLLELTAKVPFEHLSLCHCFLSVYESIE